MPGSTTKKCVACQSTIGVASKKCKVCGEAQPYKVLKQKRLEKAKERIRRSSHSLKANAVKIVDAAYVNLHNLQAAGYTPILLLGKKKGSKVKSELLKLSENSSPEEHEACQAIQSTFENFLNVHFDGTTPPATSSSSTTPPVSSEPVPHQSSTTSLHCTLTMPTSSSTASVLPITLAFSTPTSSQPTYPLFTPVQSVSATLNPTPSISVTFLPPHTVIPSVSASPDLTTSSIAPPTPTVSSNPAFNSPFTSPFGFSQLKGKDKDVIPPEGTALQVMGENPDCSAAESSFLPPVSDATAAPDLHPTVQSNAPPSRGAKRTKPQTSQRKAKPRDVSIGPYNRRKEKRQKELKRRRRGGNNSGAKHQNHCCASTVGLQAKVDSLEEEHSGLQNPISELVKQVEQLKDLVGAQKPHCEVPAEMEKVEDPIEAEKTHIPPEDQIPMQALYHYPPTMPTSMPLSPLLSHEVPCNLDFGDLMTSETLSDPDTDVKVTSIEEPSSKTEENSVLQYMFDGTIPWYESSFIMMDAPSTTEVIPAGSDRANVEVPDIDAEMDENNTEGHYEWGN